jgi:nitroreductase
MELGKPIVDIIRARYSCRTYEDRPIQDELRQRLSSFIASTTTGPFGNGARFELAAATAEDRAALKGLGTYGFIRGATAFLIGAIKTSDGDMEDYGYLMERIILFATGLGLGTCWLGGSFTKSSFAHKISARDGELVPAVASVGYIAPSPRLVESLIRRGAASDRRLPWQRLFFDGSFDSPLSPKAAGAHAVPLEMVRLGPSASNKQPWRIVRSGNTWHFFLQRNRGYGQGRLRKTWAVADMQRIDMGIAMCHFQLAARELGLEGIWLRDEPAIARPDELTQYTVSWIG